MFCTCVNELCNSVLIQVTFMYAYSKFDKKQFKTHLSMTESPSGTLGERVSIGDYFCRWFIHGYH